MIGATQRGICLLEFAYPKRSEPQLAELRKLYDDELVEVHHELHVAVVEQLHEYFTRKRTVFDLPLDLRGAPFQLKVWHALLAIPFGETVSYIELARRIGDAKTVRAVGRANGQNRIAIVIPCHRVIGSDGSLVGYGGGIDRKRFLLNLERKYDLFS